MTSNSHVLRLIQQGHSCADCARPGICALYAPRDDRGQPDQRIVCPEWRNTFKHGKAA